MRILLVEDDPEVAAVLSSSLRDAGYDVLVAADGEAGLEAGRSPSLHAIVLDWMLPRRDGASLCRALREERVATPLLMISARDPVEDRIRGLDAGADDYLTKPFAITELLARLRALLRRSGPRRQRMIRIDTLVIDTAERRVERDGRAVVLGKREYELLAALAINERRVLTREVILSSVWCADPVASNTVDVHIMALRRKIDSESTVKLIHTIRGVGYMLRVPEEEA
ncbi:MAG: response regulator transcription factor [Armatimonadota bacterium]